MGPRPKDRKAIILAFIAKAVWNLPTTRALIDFLKAGRTVGTLCGWERAAEKPKKEGKARPAGGRPKKGHKRGERQPKRLELQAERALGENLADLPRLYDHGYKRNSKGFHHMWKGYKLHMAVADCGAPICAVLTSASTHDSQAAIPLMQMAAGRATVLYSNFRFYCLLTAGKAHLQAISGHDLLCKWDSSSAMI